MKVFYATFAIIGWAWLSIVAVYAIIHYLRNRGSAARDSQAVAGKHEEQH